MNRSSAWLTYNEFEITPVGGGQRVDYSQDPDRDMLINDNRTARYKPVASLSGPWGSEENTEWN